jgi:hypothetical protein
MQTFKFDPPQMSTAVARMVGWTRNAKTQPERYTNGQHLARSFARLHGYAVILWNDGHTTLYVAD